MLKNQMKKVVSVLLSSAIVFGFTGCLDFGGGKKAVIEAAGELAENMAAADASKLIKNSTLDKKSDEATALTELLSAEYGTDDEKAFYKAVEATIEYEVDEESVSVNKGEASIDIIFTICDYSKVLQDEYTNIDDLTAAVKKAKTTEVKFTAEFVKEDKEWIPDNVGSKKFMKLYDYRNADINFALTADMISGFIDTTMSGFWLADDDDIYFDTDFIEYDYYFDSAVLDYAARGERMYFVLSKDGSDLYYGPDFIFGESTNVVCRVDGDLIGLSSGDTFETGTYTISLYYVGPYGDEIVDVQSCFVEKSVVVTPPTTGGGNPGDTFPGEGEYYAFEDLTFRSYVINAKWFDYDGYRTGDAVYSTDVLTIAFSLEVDPSCNMTVDYSYYYTDKEDRDSIGEALQNPVYSNTVSPTSYSNGTFYDIDYPVGGEAAPGFYMFVIYEAGTSNVLMYGFCNVA
ncbi:MAG: hypothetical protein IKE09_01195 [Clostridiales bacterium]|nr:hypothetical protein [Clostridiales bacterium]